MPLYFFEAIDSFGKPVRDEGIFESSATMYLALKKKGLVLTDYKRRRFSLDNLRTSRLKRMVVAEFLRNLSMIIRGGVPIIQAMEDFLNNPAEPALKRKLAVIYDRLTEGFQLSEALEAAGGFSPIVVVLARIGEESGNLDKTLSNAATHLENIQDIINKP